MPFALMTPRARKVLGDIAENPAGTALAILAMSAGVFGLGMILTAWSVLARELPRAYLATRPASAVFRLDRIDEETAALARRAPGIADAEARPQVRGRLRRSSGDWAPLIAYVVPDFRHVRIDRITSVSGAWPPGEDEILLERTALSVAGAAVGDRVTVRTASGERSVRIVGTVHAPGLPPAWMEHMVFAYIGWNSALREGPEEEVSELRVVTQGDVLDAARIRAEAERARAWLAPRGVPVSRIDVPSPGRHPHAAQMETFLFLLGAFGALALILGAALVATMIHALLAGQVRQIGIMQAIGARTGQIAAMALGHVALLAMVSLAVGMPLGILAGRAYVRFAASMLNMDIASQAPPWWVVALQIAVGALVPLAVSLAPIVMASRVTIHRALGNDTGRAPFGSRPFERRLAGWEAIPRPLRLSLRTALARRGRLALTAGMLAAGGAAFVSAFNAAGAWTHAIDRDARTRRYDLEVRLREGRPAGEVTAAVVGVTGVTHAEPWSETTASLIGPDGTERARVGVIGPVLGTPLLVPLIHEGRGLAPGDAGAVVVNQVFLARDPSLRVGSSVLLRARGHDLRGTIVGVTTELFPVPLVYAPEPAVHPLTGVADGETRSLRIVTTMHDPAFQTRTGQEIEAALARAGIDVESVHALADSRKSLEDHLLIILSALLLAAALVLLVGCAGLASALSIGVIERTREIGILGAIGATPRAIARDVVLEGVLIGILSWALAIALAVPLTLLLGSVTGGIFFKAPLPFFMSPGAAAAWLILVVLLASAAGALPAWRASRLTISEALAHV